MANPRIIETHDWISVDFGGGRRLTTSWSGEKATGAVPRNVFTAWAKFVDDFRKGPKREPPTPTEKPFLRAIERWVESVVPAIWPDWSVLARVPEVGEIVRYDFGSRRGGVDEGPITKVTKTRATVQFARHGSVSVTHDMIESGDGRVRGEGGAK